MRSRFVIFHTSLVRVALGCLLFFTLGIQACRDGSRQRSSGLPRSCEARDVELSTVMQIAQTNRLEFLNLWLGIPVFQFPTDLLTYQALIYETRPDVVIETGTALGGLSVYLAGIFESLGEEGEVVTVDINAEGWNRTLASAKLKESLRNRITFLHGSSTSPEVFDAVRAKADGKRVLVILDSAHHKQHVLREIELYSQLVMVGGYIVVNDTHLDGTAELDYRAGPRTAVDEFIHGNSDFVIDDSKQPFMISCFHGGILKRVR